MGLIITKQADIDAYFESDDVSQSELKKLLYGFEHFLDNQKSEKELFYEEKDSFVIGSAVDCLLTGEPDAFGNQYYISPIVNKPSDVEMSIIHSVFDKVINDRESDTEIKILSDYPGFIQSSIEEHGWQPRWKMDTKVNKIMEVGKEYFNDLVVSYGKQVLSEQQYFLVTDIITSLREHPVTGKYFNRGLYQNNANIDIYYQLPIYFVHEGVKCKALLDMVIITKNPETNKVESVQIVDLKTMAGHTIKFPSSLKRWRYDIQAAWYTLAVQYFLKNFHVNVSDLFFHPFKFVVESTTKTGKPLVFEMTEELMKVGESGMPELSTKDIFDDDYPVVLFKEKKGYTQLFKEYQYYTKTEWKENKVIADNNGILRLDWNGIIEN